MQVSSDARFDTYNAKWLTPAEVAKSFAPPPSFSVIAKRRNSLIVGPRGSGKTTLLKMLTGSALAQWGSRSAGRLRGLIDYTGVFIATDVSWNFQVTSLSSFADDVQLTKSLQRAALAAHTHKALVDAMEERAKYHASAFDLAHRDAALKESEVIRELSVLWKLSPSVPSFTSLKSSLRARIQFIHELAMSPTHRTLAPEEDFLTLPLLISCRSAAEHFNDVYGEQGRYWAFLFDEVELLPKPVREELYQYLRTFPGPIIIKLALSPYDEDLPQPSASASPERDADYDFVPLWYAKKRSGYRFCRELWDAMLSKSKLAGIRPEEVLGRSLLDIDSSEWRGRGTAYSLNSSHQRYLTELARSDSGFRQYLSQHKINLDAIENVKGTARASTLRKVFPLVVARVEMRRMTETEEGSLRSRKVSNIYTGATSVFDISEGNPRRFIGLIGRMLERLPEGQVRLDSQIQADEIMQAAARYRALLRTVVVPDISARAFKRGLLSLLDPIGKRLQELSLVERFSPEPPGTIVVDSRIDDEMARVVGFALNVGALIHVPDREGEEQLLSNERVRGKKFRLSYLLCAYYGIPPRLGRQVSLTELLRVPPRAESEEPDSLFGGIPE